MPRFCRLIFWILLPLGLALLSLAASRGEFVYAQGLSATATPTIDRLAKPTLPPNPSQADKGSVDYWLNCSPCHGDRGQGLTAEFRQVYPTEDQNCWLSGCHGRRPYPNGWTIPALVPALVGPGSLAKFANAAVLDAYIRAKMPFQWPGTLDADTYWRLTAFLMRQNGYWDGQGFLDESTAERVRIPFAQPQAAQVLPTSTGLPASTPLPTPRPPSTVESGSTLVRVISAGLLLLLLSGLILIIRRKKTS